MVKYQNLSEAFGTDTRTRNLIMGKLCLIKSIKMWVPKASWSILNNHDWLLIFKSFSIFSWFKQGGLKQKKMTEKSALKFRNLMPDMKIALILVGKNFFSTNGILECRKERFWPEYSLTYASVLTLRESEKNGFGRDWRKVFKDLQPRWKYAGNLEVYLRFSMRSNISGMWN